MNNLIVLFMIDIMAYSSNSIGLPITLIITTITIAMKQYGIDAVIIAWTRCNMIDWILTTVCPTTFVLLYFNFFFVFVVDIHCCISFVLPSHGGIELSGFTLSVNRKAHVSSIGWCHMYCTTSFVVLLIGSGFEETETFLIATKFGGAVATFYWILGFIFLSFVTTVNTKYSYLQQSGLLSWNKRRIGYSCNSCLIDWW